MNRTAALIALLLATAVPSLAGRYALLIGNSAGEAPDLELQYVANDLSRLRGVLTQLCGFEGGNVVSVYNGGVADTRQALSALRARVAESGADDMLLLYYTGHADDEALRMSGERLALTELRDSLAAFPARIRVAVFDACQSGSFTRLKGGTLAPPFLFASDSRVEGLVVLSSSSEDENAQESDALKSSVFTFHIVNALRGSADASGDGRVTLGEAYQYAYNHTVSATMHSAAGAQHPSYRFELKGEGDVVLADLNLRTSGMVIGQDIEGKLTVVDAGRTVVADLDKVRGSAVVVALAPGTYEVSRRAGNAISGSTVTVPSAGMAEVRTADFTQRPAPGQTTRTKGARMPRDTYWGFSLGLAYTYVSLDQPNGRMSEEFSSYRTLGLETAPHMPSSFLRTSVGVDLWIIGRVGVGLELAYAGNRHSGADEASRVNAADSVAYLMALNWSTCFEAIGICPGVSYRVPGGPLRNLTVRLGLDIHRVAYSVRTTLEDGLYRLNASQSVSEDGLLALPSLSLSYHLPVRGWLDVGAMIRYRYQNGSRELRAHSDPYVDYETAGGYYDYYPNESYRYDLGGVDVKLFVTFNAGKDK